MNLIKHFRMTDFLRIINLIEFDRLVTSGYSVDMSDRISGQCPEKSDPESRVNL